MVAHIKTHKPQTCPYKCDFCGEEYEANATGKRQLASHTGRCPAKRPRLENRAAEFVPVVDPAIQDDDLDASDELDPQYEPNFHSAASC